MTKSTFATPSWPEGGHNGEDRRVAVIEAHGVDRHEAREVVLVCSAVAMPGNRVQRRVRILGGPEATHELAHDFGPAFVLPRSHRCEEVARIRKAVRADGAELGQAKLRTVVFADVASRGSGRQLDLEFHAARDHADLAGCDKEPPGLGEHQQRALLGHQHHLAVRIHEAAVGHRTAGAINVHCNAGLRGRVARAGHRHESVYKIQLS